MDANFAAVAVAFITATASVVNVVLNRHSIKQNNEIKKQVNGNNEALRNDLREANNEIARLNRLLTPRGEPDRRVRSTHKGNPRT